MVSSVCDQFPSVKEMNQFADEKLLKAHIDERHKLAYPLLRWILMSNRAHLSKLPSDKQITELQTPHQYVLVSDNPKKEAIFRQVPIESYREW